MNDCRYIYGIDESGSLSEHGCSVVVAVREQMVDNTINSAESYIIRPEFRFSYVGFSSKRRNNAVKKEAGEKE